MRRPVVAWSCLALSIVLTAVALAFTLAEDGDLFEILAFLVIGGPFVVVGALIASRQPRQPIGWLMLGVGLTLSAALACDAATAYGLERPGTTIPVGYLAAISAVVFAIFFTVLVWTLLLLPDGRFGSSRWRPLGRILVALIVIDVTLILRPGLFSDWDEEGLRNPLGVERLGVVLGPLEQLAILLTFVLLVLAVVSVALRFRGARGVERAQLRWIAASVVVCGATWIVMLMVNLLFGDSPIADVAWGMALVSIGLIPIGIGFAVLRYRLFEIDRLISRALVYAVLTVVLVVAYVGFVLLGQWLFSSFAGGSDLAIAGSTLVVAALFLPLRVRVQRIVDRRFNRRRYDAQRTLEGFGTRLREQVELDELSADLRTVVGETMQPAHASIWLRAEVRQ